MPNSKNIIKASATFIKVKVGGEDRYYSETAYKQRKAELPDGVRMNGVGVYNTAISTDYAVAVFGSDKEADAFAKKHGDDTPAVDPIVDQLREDEIDSDEPKDVYDDGEAFIEEHFEDDTDDSAIVDESGKQSTAAKSTPNRNKRKGKIKPRK